MSERDLLKVLLEEAEFRNYGHGGARIVVPDETGSELVADFYGNGEWRAFFKKLIEDAGRRAHSAPAEHS